MATPKDLPQDIGAFIRDLRQTAKISLRQLADKAGVSNPYLSQIERGLRKPSAEVLQQLASALRVSTPAMYLRAGLLDGEGQQGVLAAIAVDPELTIAQKQSLSQIYETFRNENARHAPATGAAGDPDPQGPEAVPDEDEALRAVLRDAAVAEDSVAATPEAQDDAAATPEAQDDAAATPEAQDDAAATPEARPAPTPGTQTKPARGARAAKKPEEKS
ncbi:helix-turn-helix domain-containing protein [Actinoplanes sp. NPDC051859]|uniref:helix-turn-helix domain-containing protein n=1 Tax=Actinoplanes sp. NPDC051859 TaxID=3363909 RepID=UPI0037BD0EC2